MIIRVMASLFVLIILNIVLIVTGIEFSSTRDAEINKLLKKLNKPALKSIKSPDGDIIDCVHMKNHPIYDHPLLKNHIIQMKPSYYPKRRDSKFSTTKKHNMMTQLWTINGKCPKNSIPIIRTKRKTILQAESIEIFGKKNPYSIPQRNPTNQPGRYIHEYAIVRQNSSQVFHGARAVLNVWKPYVQLRREFSLAQTWIVAGPHDTVNTIEAGWQVYRLLYDDYRPRFFIYWTADGYNKTGCYNLNLGCSGFVQTNNRFAIGGVIPQFSLFDRQQIEFDMTIWKDSYSGHWWLMLGEHELLGYWPSTIFTHLQLGATQIDWGGEITEYRNGSQRTTTQMGSGHFADEGYRKASYFKGLLTIDEHGHVRQPVGLTSITTNAHCYNLLFAEPTPTWGHSFFYGGPGRNPTCK